MGSPRFEITQAPGFQLVRAWFPPGAVLPRHAHDRTNIMVMLRGSFVLGIRGREIACGRSTIAIEPQGEPHHNQVGTGGAEVMVVQPDPSSQSQWQPFASDLESLRHARSVEAHTTARRLSDELRATDAITGLAREALAIELLVHAVRIEQSTRQAPSWLTKVEEMLRETNEPPSLATLAREVGHHPVHVARAFRRHYGASIGTWARQVRLERAAARLLSSNDPVAMIAASLGFCDQSHFTSHFRRQFGLPPGTYRRLGRANPQPEG
jgi:AraC family transcriptional regulator